MNPKYDNDQDYAQGYVDGQKSKKEYSEESAKRYGVSAREIIPLRYGQGF